MLLDIAGVDLFVYFSGDGTASVLEGSTYPTEQTQDGGCSTMEVTLPVLEDFSYSLNLNSGVNIPSIDIIGLESLSPYKGEPAGSISIQSSSVFDDIPISPTEVTIPFAIDTSSVFKRSNGVLEANTTLPGTTSGYAIYSTDMYSFIDFSSLDPNGFIYNENNPPQRPSLYIEWHAIDGTINNSGFGDFDDVDEDGDGTYFDTIFGLDSIRVTKLNATDGCGYTGNPYIVGYHTEDLHTVKYNQCLQDGDSNCIEVADTWVDQCIDKDVKAADPDQLYFIDLEQDPNFNWGGYVTWNSGLYNSTGDSQYLVDDSNQDFNAQCMDDGDFSDCSGRILYQYTSQCIPTFNMRYFMAELQEQCALEDQDECEIISLDPDT